MKVGICGLGDRAGYLVDVFRRKIPFFDVVAYADPEPAGLRRLDSEFAGKLRGYSDLDHMLNGEKLDLVMIGSPNAYHCDQLCTVLDAGLKVFCEKPVVVSEDETLRVLGALKQHGVDRVIVGLVLRYAPLYRDLFRMNEEGVFGDIMSIEASETIPPWHGGFFFRDWRRKTSLSGGFMLEKCCHDLDLYAGLVNARPKRVVSFGGCSFFGPHNQQLAEEKVYQRWPTRWNKAENSFSGDADIVDHQVALIEYSNGTRLCFHTNVHAPAAYRHFYVIGSDGMAEGDFVRGYLKTHNARSSECVFDKTYMHDGISIHYGAEASMAADIKQHLEIGAPLPVSVVDALAAGITAIKIDESRTTGEVVDLTQTWQRFDDALAT